MGGTRVESTSDPDPKAVNSKKRCGATPGRQSQMTVLLCVLWCSKGEYNSSISNPAKNAKEGVEARRSARVAPRCHTDFFTTDSQPCSKCGKAILGSFLSVCSGCRTAAKPPAQPKSSAARNTLTQRRAAVNAQIRKSKQQYLNRGIRRIVAHLDALRPFLSEDVIERLTKASQGTKDDSRGTCRSEPFAEQPEYIVGGSIKPYQYEGVRFLISLHDDGLLGGILGDEMGLGTSKRRASSVVLQ